jgi:hypothetical protein
MLIFCVGYVEELMMNDYVKSIHAETIGNANWEVIDNKMYGLPHYNHYAKLDDAFEYLGLRLDKVNHPVDENKLAYVCEVGSPVGDAIDKNRLDAFRANIDSVKFQDNNMSVKSYDEAVKGRTMARLHINTQDHDAYPTEKIIQKILLEEGVESALLHSTRGVAVEVPIENLVVLKMAANNWGDSDPNKYLKAIEISDQPLSGVTQVDIRTPGHSFMENQKSLYGAALTRADLESTAELLNRYNLAAFVREQPGYNNHHLVLPSEIAENYSAEVLAKNAQTLKEFSAATTETKPLGFTDKVTRFTSEAIDSIKGRFSGAKSLSITQVGALTTTAAADGKEAFELAEPMVGKNAASAYAIATVEMSLVKGSTLHANDAIAYPIFAKWAREYQISPEVQKQLNPEFGVGIELEKFRAFESERSS